MELNNQVPRLQEIAYPNFMVRLLGIYLLAFLPGVCIQHLECLFIDNFTIKDMIGMSYTGLNSGFLFLLAMVSLVSFWRLYPLGFMLKNGPSNQALGSAVILKRIHRLPYELLIVLLVAGAFVSLSMHFIHLRDADEKVIIPLLGAIAGEQGAILITAISIFSIVRGYFRPFVLQLKPLVSSKSDSIAQPLLIAYAGTFLAAILNILELTLLSTDGNQSIDPLKFTCIAGIYFIVGFCIFFFVTLQFRYELRGLIQNIRDLVGTSNPLGTNISVDSHDESSELAVAINELQYKINRDYESLEKEMKLAYNVQQKLLPPGDMTMGSYRITARSKPYREVGGDFFDIVSLGPSRFAVMIGDVSGKGMPAALLMSAQLLLFRSEIRRNGSPGEVLIRMNRQLCEAMGEEGAVSIGVGVIDMSTDTLIYASAGHLSPYIVGKDGTFTTIENSSLPIGFDTETCYEEKSVQFSIGDRFVLYTDGLIEAGAANGKMYSFEGLEAELATWEPNSDMAQLVDDWLLRLDSYYGPGKDDRTVVILELAGEYRSAIAQKDIDVSTLDESNASALLREQLMSREWTMRSRLGEERQIVWQLGEWIEKAWPESMMREDVQSAVAEAMINAIEHGNKLQPRSFVTLAAQIGSMLAVCKIYDEGGGFFPRVSRGEDEMLKKLESDDPRGWGLVMIDSLADYWTTGRDDKGFYTELYFMRKAKSIKE